MESSDGFAQITQTCEKQKEEDVSQLDTTDLDALQRFEQEFQEKGKTVWDPYYMLTKQTLDKE